LKIADFGLAFKMDPSKFDIQNLTKSLASMIWGGTPIYLPPEMFDSNLNQKVKGSRKIDRWAVGLIAYELLTGERFFANQIELQNFLATNKR
ncbi:hypothetical protein NQU39_25505, partial [Escherichia coli]|uniref:protein kinase domain-containing protein n=1 Tax=Escherichia coli TaxID=562 RepID=UPI0021179ECB